MQMPGRDTTFKNGYRYGFNGKEGDPEPYGVGNEYDYGFRIYNPRVGRFLSLDPLQNKRPGEAPFNYTGDNPILNVDVDGRDRIKYYVVIDEKTGNTLISTGKVINTTDLMSVHNVYYNHSGIVENWDWYDIKEVHYIIKHQNGTITNSTIETKGDFRTSTSNGLIFKGQWWANLWKNNKPQKEQEVPNGIVMTSSEGSLNGSQYNKSAKHIDAIINIDLLKATIEGLKGNADVNPTEAENKIIAVLENFKNANAALENANNVWNAAVEQAKKDNVVVAHCNFCEENFTDSANQWIQTDKPATDTMDGVTESEPVNQTPLKKKSN